MQQKKQSLKIVIKPILLKEVAVRRMKNEMKENMVDDTSCVCATFDLQQVILLPIAAESQLFYHRRLTNYNLSVYGIATKDCNCFVWHEGLGRRVSSEIATCLL